MSKKTVFIIEDGSGQRRALNDALEMRGFTVHSATSAKNANEIIQNHGEQIDVAVVDMKLDEWPETAGTNMTGADIGLALRRTQKRCPSEFLILSAFEEIDYLRLAIDLGAAAYLRKEDYAQSQVIQHVQALAIRRSINPDRAEIDDWIKTVEETTRDPSDIVLKFCQDVLLPEMAQVLGSLFVLLVSTHRGTYRMQLRDSVCSGPHSAYGTLQAVVHGVKGRMDPFCLNLQEFSARAKNIELNVLQDLEGAVFVPLARDRARISVGIREPSKDDALSDSVFGLSSVLAEYIQPAMLDHIIRMTSRFARLAAQQKAVLSATSQVCLFAGQEQLSLLSRIDDAETELLQDPNLRKMRALAEDLRDVGGQLCDIDRTEGEDKPQPQLATLALAEVVQKAWDYVSAKLKTPPGLFALEGTSEILGDEADLDFALTKLLQWLATRAVQVGVGARPAILVTCEQTPEFASVVIEDRGPRLPDSLRKRLFFPFAQAVPKLPNEEKEHSTEYLALYMARVLIELKNKGMVQDRTADMSIDHGHCFVIRFPRVEGQSETKE